MYQMVRFGARRPGAQGRLGRVAAYEARCQPHIQRSSRQLCQQVAASSRAVVARVASRSPAHGHLTSSGLLARLSPGLAAVVASIWVVRAWGNPCQCEEAVAEDLVLLGASMPPTRRVSRYSLSLAQRWERFVRIILRGTLLFWLFFPVACAAPVCWLATRHPSSFARFLERCYWKLTIAAFEAAGPTFVKLAQWASTRPDLLSRVVTARLAKLQHAVTPHSYRDTEIALQHALGPRWTDALSFERTPVGSGCIAQVYRGRELSSGREVAVKVRHPGAREKMELDLEVMHFTINRLESLVPSLRYLAISEALEHFEEFLWPQVDFRVEASNLRKFGLNFGDTPRRKVFFPEVVNDLTSEGVLVESFEHGVSLSKVLEDTAAAQSAVAAPGISAVEIREGVGKLCMDTFLKMVFVDNFVHADLHPGNILCRFPAAQGYRTTANGHLDPELVVLDAGLAVELSRSDRRNFIELFHAIAINDGRMAGELMLDRTPGDASRIRDPQGFVAGVAGLVSEVQEGGGVKLGHVRIGDILGRMLSLACDHRVKLETSFVTTVMGIIVAEGVGRQLDPSVDLLGAAKPLLVEAVVGKLW